MLQPNHPFVMQVSWARCGSDFASVFQRKWLHDFRYRVSNNQIREYINCVMYIRNICLIQTKGMGKVWHPGMPNTPKGDDYPKSWSEKVFYLKSKWKTAQCPWLLYPDVPYKFHWWPKLLMESLLWGGNGGNHSEVHLKFHQMKTHALLRDIANTDYTIEKLRELAPAALVGEQNFFVAYGLHKVHCYILIIPDRYYLYSF